VAQRCKIMGVELPPPRPAPLPTPEPALPEDLLNVSILENFEPEQLFEIISHAIQCAKEARARREQYARERGAEDQDDPPRPATAGHPSGFSRPAPVAAPHGGFSSHFEKHDMATGRQSEFSPSSQLGGAEGDGQTPPVAIDSPHEFSRSVPAAPQDGRPWGDVQPREMTTSRQAEAWQPGPPGRPGGAEHPAGSERHEQREGVIRDAPPPPVPPAPPPEILYTNTF
ncbi:MAG: hypothetical protein HY290_22685, partial [Planctomycetia bacterium]|nr:hypothetical protein [Planctomycetia bacterium]